jgi:hypothetical protein
MQGFAGLKETLSTGSTVWGAYHLPQNRDVCLVSSGDGTMHLYKYSYPDQRKVKVGGKWGADAAVPCTFRCGQVWPGVARWP